MKKLILAVLSIALSVYALNAQELEEKPSLQFSGSVDTYYKYDFSGQNNIGTSFNGDHNSFSIGMLNLIAEHTIGKASFVGDIAFGPRNANSAGPGGDVTEAHIQNLYVSFAVSDKVSITGGYMGTFVGYEIISPTGNFNYSTSYLFTNGPFQNAGVKMDVKVSEKFAFMVGVFNDWNVYSDTDDANDIGAQLYFSPAKGLDAYLNFVSGKSNQELDLTATYQITDEFMLGLNAAKWTDEIEGSDAEFTGVALYGNYQISDVLALGLRYENFSTKNTGYLGFYDDKEAENVNAFTFSANIGSGPLKLIPEFRFDSMDQDVFLDKDEKATGKATQFSIAAVYSF